MTDYFERIEQQLTHRVEAGLPRSPVARRRGRPAWAVLRLQQVGAGIAVLGALAIAVVFLGLHHQLGTGPSAADTGVRVVFKAEWAGHGAVTAASLAHTVDLLRERLHASFGPARVSSANGLVTIQVPAGSGATRGRIVRLTAVGQLDIYDWEGTALTPGGRTLASQLAAQDPSALQISQGSGDAAPGLSEAGGLDRAAADRLSSRHPGSVVLKAELARSAHQAKPRFFVVAGTPALTGADVTHPRTSTTVGNEPAVAFGFTRAGARAFHTLTSRLAHRGNVVSGLGQKLDQHFAYVLDRQLLSVAAIDFVAYPDGIVPSHGADVVGDFTRRSASDLTTILRYGPLPVRFVPVP